MDKKISRFTDLVTWQEAHKLVLSIYKITNQFPSKEKFSLTSQIRRSAISLTSNIAEGFSRNTNKDKYQFYSVALGSLTELQNQVFIARDVGYIKDEEFKKLVEQTIKIHKLINGLKKMKFSNT